jgi:rhodanese-related sulfurtransferase
MRRLFLLTLMAGTVAFAQQAQTKDGAKAKKLTRAEIDQALEHPERVVFLDVRRPDEISSIGGFAVYLNIQAGELEKHLAEIPKDRAVITVSNHASRAGKAADLLESKGFKVLGAVGVEDYEAEGGKPVKIAIPPPNANAKQDAKK